MYIYIYKYIHIYIYIYIYIYMHELWHREEGGRNFEHTFWCIALCGGTHINESGANVYLYIYIYTYIYIYEWVTAQYRLDTHSYIHVLRHGSSWAMAQHMYIWMSCGTQKREGAALNRLVDALQCVMAQIWMSPSAYMNESWRLEIHDSFICVLSWLIYMRAIMTHSYACYHDSFICVLSWLIHMQERLEIEIIIELPFGFFLINNIISLSHSTHMNESWHICEGGKVQRWADLLMHWSVSWHTYEWVIAHTWMSHGAYMNESWHTYKWVISHIWMREGFSFVCHNSCIYAPWHIHVSSMTHTRLCCTGVMSHTRVSCGTQKRKGTSLNWHVGLLHICEWVMAHVWMRHSTHMSDTHMHQLWHTEGEGHKSELACCFVGLKFGL